MLLPTQNAIARLSHAGTFQEVGYAQSLLLPQAKYCTPCVRIGGGQWCVNIPIIGRKCFSVPSAGTWKACCTTKWGWPPISCGISRC